MSKHTPGPWKIEMSSTCSGAWPKVFAEFTDPKTGAVWTQEIAELQCGHIETDAARQSDETPGDYNEKPHRFEPNGEADEISANAHLITAAPDLLEALNEMVDINDNSGPFGGEFYRDRVERCWFNARAAIAKATGGQT